MAKAKKKPLKASEVRKNTVDWLVKKQNKDGGWGEFDSNPMCTTMASYSLFRLGEFEAANKGLAWLVGSQLPSGAWAYKYRGTHLLRDDPLYKDYWGRELNIPTTMSMLTLLYCEGETGNFIETVDKGLSWIITNQKDNGMFYDSATQAMSGNSETSLSIWSLIRALNKYGDQLPHKKKFENAANKGGRYLLSKQANDGGYYPHTWLAKHQFISSWLALSNIYATAEALCGVVEYEGYTGNLRKSKTVDKGLKWLLKQQNKDGGWGLKNVSRIEETAYVVLLGVQLLDKGVRRSTFYNACEEGIRWMASTQDKFWQDDLRHTATFNTAFAAMILSKSGRFKLEV